MTKPALPTPQHDLVRGSKIDKIWYQFFQKLADAFATHTQVQASVDTAVAAIPPTAVRFHETDTTEVTGTQADGFIISLRGLEDSGIGTAVYKTTRDSFGRIKGQVAATTDDVPEGTLNLYFTVARVRATLLDGLSTATNAVIAATDSVLVAFGKAQAQVSHILANYVPNTRAVNTTAPLTGGGNLAADLTLAISAATTTVPGSMSAADKTKLDGVATGATAYTDAMARAAAVADTIADAVTNIAPSQNAVFDALATKATHADLFTDFIVTGLLSPTSANLTSTISAGTAYVTGLRVVKAAEAFTYAASSDTYEDLASTGVITRTAVANGGAVPAITANNIRLQKVVTDATAVTAVTRVGAVRSTGTFSTLSASGVVTSGGFRDAGTLVARFEGSGGGVPAGSTGVGGEFFQAGGIGYLQVYNRTSAVWAPMRARCTSFTVDLQPGGDIAVFSTTGLAVTGEITASTTIKTGSYTVATLPAGVAGQRAYVTDATAPTWNGALTGGGAVVVPVFRNATAWVSA